MYMVDSSTKNRFPHTYKLDKWSYASVIFVSQGVLKNNPAVWLDGARLHPKYIIVQSKHTLSGLANFLSRDTPICMVDSLTFYVGESIIGKSIVIDLIVRVSTC